MVGSGGFVQPGSGLPALAEVVGVSLQLEPPGRGLLDAGVDLYTIQRLLGHADLRHTLVYLQLSERHLRAAPIPIDALTLSDPSQVKRSRKLIKK